MRPRLVQRTVISMTTSFEMPARSFRAEVRICRVIVAAGLIVALLGPSALKTPAAATTGRTDTATPGVPRLDWTECGDGRQCATATVPLDYDEPNGRTIRIALARHPATDPTRRIGSMFVNPGGPGGSGVGYVQGDLRTSFTEETLARFDIVGFDPRGVGSTEKVRCFDSPSDHAAFIAGWEYLGPAGRAQERVAARRSRELVARCWARSGWLLPHVSTANVARDLDRLRQAVGDARLTYTGYSYGTHLGQTYANMFPDKVRALVLDAVVDPVKWTGGGRGLLGSSAFLRMAADTASWEVLRQFFRRCAEAGPDRCPLADGAGPEARFAQLAQRARRQPFELADQQGRITLNYGELIFGTLVYGLYFVSEWAATAQALAELETGNSARFGQIARVLKRDAGDMQGVSVICSESRTWPTPHWWPAIAGRADDRSPYAGRYWTYATQPCAWWPEPDADAYRGPWNQKTAAPVLFIGTRYDPGTPYHNAVDASRMLPGSRLLTVEGYGHTTIGVSRCAHRAMERYLIDGHMPEPGAVCRQDAAPF
jgi:pimeloyl-ACP methyl ester carboxylesterase